MSDTLRAVKGMNDILPPESARWEWFEDKVRALMRRHGYLNVRTPVVEPTALFVRGLGAVTDIVEKEMYSFEDAMNGDRLTLRPEATAGIVRAMVEHNALYNGPMRVWSAVPLFIVVLTAMPISFPWANALVYRVVGEEPPQQGGRGGREGGPPREDARRDRPQPALGGLDALVTKAAEQSPGWKTINLRLPASDRAPVAFAIDRGDGGQPQLRSTLSLDRSTGAVVNSETFSDQSLGRRLRSISRFAHTGEVLGLPGQTIAGLATAGAVVLVWTGIALALRRCRAWIARRKRTEKLDPRHQETAA